LWMQTTFYPLQLFSENCHGESLQSFVECDKYDAGDFKQVPYLDVSSVYNAKTKELLINVVNRHKDKAIETNIANQFGQLGTKAIVYEVNSNDINDENTVNEQKVKTTEKEVKVNGSDFVYNFPAHSFTMLKIKMK